LKRRSSHSNGRRLLPGFRQVLLTALLVLATLILLAACGGERSGSGKEEAELPEETSGEVAFTPAEATVSPNEDTAMPAGGKAEDPDQPPPENPPEGVKTYPATTNKNVNGPITYEQDPPANGDHAPYWQNCGFYSTLVENEAAVHSLDHGAVWITYRPDLPVDQLNILRRLAQGEYVLISPYPGLYAPVVATAWRNQLELTGADDPRLQQFVDQFRVSATAPRSGNGCTDGVGEPESL
jgi:uncharacterized protein DUF3105